MPTQTPERGSLLQLVIESLREILEQVGLLAPAKIDGSTSLIGQQAVLNSLALVTLLVELEQKIEEAYEVVLTIADDRAMSQKHSPFRTVDSLTAYIENLIAEERVDG